MKSYHLRALTLLSCLFIGIIAHAHDFEAQNSDGVTIYYNITSSTNKTCEVTYAGDSYNSYSNEYTGSIVIPKTVIYNGTYDGTTYSVTSIGDWAFHRCSGLTSITIPNSVTSIGKYAFNGCIGLTSVNILDLEAWCKIDFGDYDANPLYYAKKLYLNDKLLTNLEIPNSITEIKDYAFRGCTGLTSITIPNSVTSIGDRAFGGCTGLTTIKVETGNSKYDSRDNCNAIIETTTNTLIIGCKNTAIPNSITSIGNYAFYYCSGLTSVTIPNSVTIIGRWAFMDCSSLTSVTIPNSVTSIGDGAFYGCDGLTSVTIPNSVTSIGESAFKYCSSLTSVTIPNSVTRIGIEAFDGCSGLTNVIIPNSVTSIGSMAFYGCTSLASIAVETGNSKYDSRNNCNAIIETTTNTLIIGCKNTAIPNSITSIGNYAFRGCTGLTSVTIPNSVTSIGSMAFYGCRGLTSITIPNSVTNIGWYAFYDCSGLTRVTSLSTTPPTCGTDVFYNVSVGNITLEVPAESVSMYQSADTWKDFGTIKGISESSTLTYKILNETDVEVVAGTEKYTGDIVIPSQTTIDGKTYSVTSIGNSAFYRCSGLTSVIIPNSATSIGSDAFRECIGLTSVTIPNSITSIGSGAFYYCSGLTSVTIPNSVTIIGPSAFSHCSGLPSVTIPNSVTSIGDGAFDGCSGLTSVIFNAENCETMGSSSSPVFENCTSLSSVTIGENVKNIPNYAFRGCSGLKELRIEDGETTLSLGYNSYSSSGRGEGLFYDCPLETVYIGRSLSYATSYSNGYSPFYNNTIESLTFGTKVLTTGGGYFNSIIKTIWLTNTPPEGYANVSSKMNYVANDLYTSLENVTIYPYLSSIFEVGGVKYVPVSPSERTCDAIDCSYSPNAENINLGNTVSYKGIEMTVNEIKPYVCYNNDYINNATIDYTKEIPIYAFNDCNVVNNANIKASSIGEYAFSGSATQTPATLKVEAETIANKAFEGCTAIENAEIKATSIGESAFEDCSALNMLSVTAESIGYYAFRNSATSSSATFSINTKSIGYESFKGCTGVTSATLSDYLATIGASAFSGCSCLSGIVLPNSVTSLGANAFYNCGSLSSVSIGTGIPAINDYTFYGCSSLPEINIPSNVTSIGNYVFDGCTSLANVTIADRETELTLGSNGSEPMFASCPLNTVYIGGNINYPTSSSSGYSPFYRNTSLETVTITDKETEISENEFYGCAGLKNVTMGDGVETIGNWAFSGCSSLDYFSFGSGMKTIGEEAFSDCTAMTKLISSATVPPTCGTQALDDINKWNCELVVPKTVVSAYQAADQWKEFFFITGSDDLVSGVEETLIDGYEDEHAVYYNLQGVKVENPERGLYIKRQGSKTSKVIL